MDIKLNYVFVKDIEKVKYIENKLGDEHFLLFLEKEFDKMCRCAIAAFLESDYPYIYLYKEDLPKDINCIEFYDFMFQCGVKVVYVDYEIDNSIDEKYFGFLFKVNNKLVKYFKFYDDFNKIKEKANKNKYSLFTKNVFGYIRYKKRGMVYVVKEPTESEIVKYIHDSYMENKSVHTTSDEVFNKFGKKISYQTVRRVLDNEIYAGKLTNGNKIEYDSNLMIVDKEVKKKVKFLLRQKGPKKTLKRGNK